MDLSKMKGNLGLKSSALAPTACKLSSQFLVLDHMSNHYTKIARAKSAIDSRPPKSLMASQKMRDRMNRNHVLGSHKPRSHSSVSGTVLSDYEDVLKDEPEDEEEKLVHSIMRSTLLEKSRSSNNATYSAGLHMDPYQHQHMSTNIHDTSPYGTVVYDHLASVHSVRSGHSLTSSPSRVAIATSLLVKRTFNGDVLEKRPHLFTEPERLFTPRTLKKKTESRLKNSKCYNSPQNKSAKKDNCEVDMDKNGKKDAVQNYSQDINILGKGRIKNKKQQSKFQSPQQQNNTPQKVKDHSGYDLEATSGTSKLSSSMLMDISVRSRDKAHNQETVNGVPPLAITMDKDHMNWLQEQAGKAEVRVRSSGRLKSSLYPEEELHSASRYHSQESGVEADVKMEKQRKDEEQKYLTFAKEVTDDVLSRGISADSVLDKVFENHIVRCKDDLDEDRMRKVISDLRKNLGLKDSFTRRQDSASVSDDNYSNKSKMEHPTGRSRGSHPVNSDPDVNSTLQSVNSTLQSVDTLKFGQTGSVLSTISSVASLHKKETEKSLEDESEMAFSQTLREYQLRLTDKEEVDESNKKAGPNFVKEDSLNNLYGEHKLANDERRRQRKVRSEVSSVEQISNIDKSPATSLQDSHAINDERRRQRKVRSEVSSVEQISNIDKSPATSLQDSHAINDEDTSVGSSVLSQRPVARPRTKARQGSQERTQAGNDEEVISYEQQDDVHRNIAGDLFQTATQRETTDSDTEQSGYTDKLASETAKLETDHQQAVEEGDEYEDDYEEIIESDNDSDDDF